MGLYTVWVCILYGSGYCMGLGTVWFWVWMSSLYTSTHGFTGTASAQHESNPGVFNENESVWVCVLYGSVYCMGLCTVWVWVWPSLYTSTYGFTGTASGQHESNPGVFNENESVRVCVLYGSVYCMDLGLAESVYCTGLCTVWVCVRVHMASLPPAWLPPTPK